MGVKGAVKRHSFSIKRIIKSSHRLNKFCHWYSYFRIYGIQKRIDMGENKVKSKKVIGFEQQQKRRIILCILPKCKEELINTTHSSYKYSHKSWHLEHIYRIFSTLLRVIPTSSIKQK